MQSPITGNFFKDLGRRWAPPAAAVASTPAGSVSAQASTAAPTHEWILSPTLDLLFACGGILWIAYVLLLSGVMPILNAGFGAALLWWASRVGMLIFSWGHQPATLWRVYMSPTTRKSVGNIVTSWAGVSVVLMFALMLIPGFVNNFIKLILFWQVQHVLAQTYGVGLIYCYKRRYFLNNFEKQTFFWMINLGILFYCVRMMTMKEAGTGNINGVVLPFWGPLPLWIMHTCGFFFTAATLVFTYNIVSRYIKKRELFPWPALLTILSGLFPWYMNLTAGAQAQIGLFLTAYFHGSQYMVVTSAYYLKERGLPEGLPFNKISRELLTPHALRYFVILVLVGWILADSVPRFFFTVFGLSQACTFGTMFCVLNFHHYFTDAIIWKLKDPEVRKLLIA